MVREVTNQEEYNLAVKSPGEISLAPGLVLSSNKSAIKDLLIRSSDPKDPASFVEFTLNGATNIQLENLVFTRAPDLETYKAALHLSRCTGISVRNSKFFVKDPRKENGNLSGLAIRSSKDVLVEGNYFSGGDVSLSSDLSSGVKIISNDIVNIGRDAMNFKQVSGVEIIENWCKGWNAIGKEHPDLAQFWSTQSTECSKDITILRNLGHCEVDQRAQGFFFNDELELYKKGLGYKGITIEDNTLSNFMWNAIYIKFGLILNINRNTILFAPNPATVDLPPDKDTKRSWIHLIGNAADSLTGNIAGEFREKATSVGNLVEVSHSLEHIEAAELVWLKKYRPNSVPKTLEERVSILEAQVEFLNSIQKR